MTVSDQILAAFVDGELGEEDERRIAAAVAADPRLRARVDRARALREQLAAHFAPVLDEPTPERLTRLLAPNPATSAKIVDLAAARARRRPPRRPPPWRQIAAVAATLVMALAMGWLGLTTPRPEVVLESGALTARGALARTLDHQLAAQQSPATPIRVGLTFYDTADRLCRTFATPTLDGLACRAGDRWTLQATMAAGPHPPAGDYRQAASGAPMIVQAAQGIMKGDALDANAERLALQRIGRGRR